MARDYIVFDGGYNTGTGQGAWAVVLIKGGKERLLDYGMVKKSSSSDIEWVAAERAAEWARRERVKLVKGDFRACVNGMSERHPDLTWEWIPSKGNAADKWAKPYEELL